MTSPTEPVFVDDIATLGFDVKEVAFSATEKGDTAAMEVANAVRHVCSFV